LDQKVHGGVEKKRLLPLFAEKQLKPIMAAK
jgi:hypothetical protein